MTQLLLDSSVIIAAFDRDDVWHPPARALVESERPLATLDLARYEVANVAVRAWRSPERAVTLLAAVDRIDADEGIVTSTGPLLATAVAVAAEKGISVYDAAYVAAAAQVGATLVSCDMRDLVDNGLALSPAEAAD